MSVTLVKMTSGDWVNPTEVAAVTRDARRQVHILLRSGDRIYIRADHVAGVDLVQRTVDQIASRNAEATS